MRLAIADLGDRGIRLAVSLYGNGYSCCFWLAIRELRHRRRHRSRSCRGTGGATDDLDVNRTALRRPIRVVQVVEAAGVALVPERRSAKRQRRVTAHGEASGVNGASLRWIVELELVIAGNIASAALGVLENAACQSENEESGGAVWTGLALDQIALGARGHVYNSDLEATRVAARASRRGRRRRRNSRGDALRDGIDGGRKGQSRNCEPHDYRLPR